MFDEQPTIELLFEQLGLDASEAGIEQFIQTHQLDQNTALHHASFWTEAQRNFIISHWKKDDEWAMVVDSLNAQLHSNDGVE
ncbi:DUF2789 domain-containing protein [Acinetobacter sp. 187]|uniref:DUF2789 domain-containing protein n=1 Tax=Acinetobacter lanii TaxID=2715163 RepID=A0A6G8S1C6_9GAMM|nr:DUF2789 family protein [Acinetobacter lanii]NHC03793.1 DUF2789 domain-containing protein [Acinetobacter lanii]QIO07947.1 DUF2789 domain-containing protein [Acinetobacter lanii]